MLRSSEEHKRTPQSRQEGHPSGWYPKAVITALVAVALGLLLYWKGYTLVIWGGYTTTAGDWDSRRQDVKEAFISNWDAYTKYAWGQCFLSPPEGPIQLATWFKEVLKWN